MDKRNGVFFNSCVDVLALDPNFVGQAKRKRAMLESNLPGIHLMDEKREAGAAGHGLLFPL